MELIRYQYGIDQYDFLNLFDEHYIKPGTAVVFDNVEFNPTPHIEEVIENQRYNYTFFRNYKTNQPWVFNNNQIPVMDTKLLIIGNPAEAKSIFSIAKWCRDNIDYYEFLLKLSIDPIDNITLSLASHIFQSPFGFFDIPQSFAAHFTYDTVIRDNIVYNNQTKAVMNISGVSTIV